MDTKKHFWNEFMKIAVAWLLFNSTAWMYCSYYLAYIGRTEIAEDLSQKVVIEILGVILVYALKSATENLSKNNTWPDKAKKEVSESDQRDC